MQLNEYQHEAARTANGIGDMKTYTAFGLAGEVGEYIETLKHETFHGWTRDYDNIAEELGDILWYVAMAAQAQGFSLEHIARGNILKLKVRYPDGFSKEASINRDQKA